MNDEMKKRFIALAERLKVKEPETIWKILFGFYSDPQRYYHTLIHIRHMLAEFDEHKNLLDWPDPVEWAIFWHDSFYSSHATGRMNENFSERMALNELGEMSKEFRDRVSLLIMSTDHQEPPKISDAKYLCDFDLTILGADEEAYEEYRQNIRQEYAWVPLKEYREARIKVLRGFLLRPAIYNTETYFVLYEKSARRNIEREIQLLREKA